MTIDKNIRSYLLKTGYEKWKRGHSKNKKYCILTSNIAESMNVANKAARDLPVAVSAFDVLYRNDIKNIDKMLLLLGPNLHLN